jgi:hypothetical protein
MKFHIFENVFSAHGNVAQFSRDLAAALRAEGHAVSLWEVGGPIHQNNVIQALQTEADALITFTGNGTDRNSAPNNVHNRSRARLIDLYLDPMAISLDAIPLPINRRILGCTSPDGLATLRPLLRADNRLLPLPHAADPTEPVPWTQRDIPILLIGNCPETPAAIRARWQAYRPEVAQLLDEAASLILSGNGIGLFDAVNARQARRPHVPLAEFRSYCTEVDRLIRAHVRAAAFAQLSTLPMTVIGEGWNKMPAGRAQLLGPRNAAEAAALTRRAKISISLTTPYHGSHERVFRAMAARAVAVATPSPWLSETIRADAMTITPPEAIADTVAALLGNDSDAEAMAERGHAALIHAHTWRHRARAIAGWLADPTLQ